MALNSVRAILFAALTAAPLLVSAQADIRVRASIDNQFATQTRTSTVTFTVTNDGPGDALDVVLTNPFAFPGSNVSMTVQQPCSLATTGIPSSPTLIWSVGRVNAQGSATCAVILRALPTSTNQAFRFALRATAQTSDPFPNNNAAGVDLSISPIDVVSDISVQVAVSPSSGLLPADGTGRVRITVSNLGPNDAASARVASDFSPFEFPPPYRFFLVPEDPCDSFIDGEYPSYSVSTGPIASLPSGSSIVCVVGIERRIGSTNGVLSLNWVGGPGGFGSLDPNMSNNSAVSNLSISTVPVPATGRTGLLVLATLALLLAVLRRSSFALPSRNDCAGGQ